MSGFLAGWVLLVICFGVCLDDCFAWFVLLFVFFLLVLFFIVLS